MRSVWYYAIVDFVSCPQMFTIFTDVDNTIGPPYVTTLTKYAGFDGILRISKYVEITKKHRFI